MKNINLVKPALLLIFSSLLLISNPVLAADEGKAKETIVLKMMIVNPSDQYAQTYSMKAYLPEEVLPEYIIGKEDLELGYDAEKKAYYVMKDLELEPGESVVKSIEIEDIWLIPQKEMEQISEEAHELYAKMKGAANEEKARLFLSNIEVLLTQIFERQNDETATPEEHISIYRDNKKKMRDVELDLVAMRRLAANKAEAGAILPFKGQAWSPKAAEKAGGAIPAWVAWRVIFGILIFLGIVTLGFYWTWQHQVLVMNRNRKLAQKSDAINLDDLFGDPLKTNPDVTESLESGVTKKPANPGEKEAA